MAITLQIQLFTNLQQAKQKANKLSLNNAYLINLQYIYVALLNIKGPKKGHISLYKCN